MEFTALYVEASADDRLANVLFADPETNPDEPSVLMFSRSIEFADSAYYFEINDQSQGRYGGLQSVHLTRNRLTATLQPEVVAEFGNEALATVQVDFDVDDPTYTSLLNTLKKIFAGDEVFVVE